MEKDIKTDDFEELKEKLKSKEFSSIYDDLEEEDDDSDPQEKKEYEKITNFSSESLIRYKKKNNIEGKIVSAQGYDDLKACLVENYGWTENKDTTSLMYDYKHMSKKNDIDYVNLLDEQVVNHFHENKSVTAKFGLTRNIRNICSMGKDAAEFFPRCFDINDVSELENFYENFKESYAQSIVLKYVEQKGLFPVGCNKEEFEKIILTAITAVERQFRQMTSKIEKIKNGERIFISNEEWDIIERFESTNNKKELEQDTFNADILKRATELCNFAKKNDPQWNLNRENIWIIKPASLSRGRGIKTFNQLKEIFDYVIGKEISWVAQKYIENPLIIKKRKFDIRQWVLLTDFKPFRVWIYDECYIRFCATEYTPENLKDRKIHLTNNSVTKGVSDIENDGICENMLSQKEFESLMKEENSGRDIFMEILQPQMKKIAVETLESVKENIVSRNKTLEILGFDFMIDEDHKVWLIEVNSSPTMEYSTKVTTNIVKRGMNDLGHLVNNYMFKGKFYDQGRENELYGGWKLLTGF